MHSDNADDPVVQYAGAGVGAAYRTFLMPDERGSIAGLFSNAGASLAKNSYDEYGIPGAANQGRFQYTGQIWLPELGGGVYYYKARIYSAPLGRFLQTDPIGYEGGSNLYAYVFNDPINGLDPNGTRCVRWNSSSPYCMRRDIYMVMDRQVGAQTRFFGAAAATVEFLANNDLPLAGFISDTAETFLSKVSSSLYSLNARAFSNVRRGREAGVALDRKLVHMEQSQVQKMLDSLPSAQREAIISSINSAFNGNSRMLANYGSPEDARYNSVLNGVRRDLGRDIDFGKQSDREAIGNAAIKDLRKSGSCDVTGSRIKAC